MDPFEITVDELLLRPWQADDADAVYRACQDPDIQRWTTVPRPYGRHEWGIDALGLARVVWRAQIGNEASRRVAEKAGLTYEGIARTAWKQRDECRDVWVASFVATDLSPTRTMLR
jgi:RimJ/RimL family protein N-acetyltransferase